MITRRERSAEEKQKAKEYHEIQQGLRQYYKVHDKVVQQSQARAESGHIGANLEEIPQLSIREVVTVQQGNFETYEEISPGDILVKEDAELIIGE